MKKILAAIVAAALIVASAVTGYYAGMRHVIYDAEIFCVEIPFRNENGAIEEGEMTVFLEIDDQVHEYSAYIG